MCKLHTDHLHICHDIGCIGDYIIHVMHNTLCSLKRSEKTLQICSSFAKFPADVLKHLLCKHVYCLTRYYISSLLCLCVSKNKQDFLLGQPFDSYAEGSGMCEILYIRRLHQQ